MWVLLGLSLSILAVLGANHLEGGQLQALLNLPAALIVLGGTLGAALVQTPGSLFLRTLQLLKLALNEPAPRHAQGINQLVHWCIAARRKGLLALEHELTEVDDPLVRNGLQLLADGKPVELIRATLEVELVAQEQRDYQAARVIESMGGYAPTLGIIGAVLGLIQVMANLEDPAMLGSGIATAFVATIYGIGLANLLLLPLAAKMRQIIDSRSLYQEMMLEGLLFIAEGQGPKSIQLRLQGYLERSDAKTSPA
jgi:chemotaxis protein MotA